ncbi:MAG: nucleotidyltransferase family protein [Thermomicrobiales bacterium]
MVNAALNVSREEIAEFCRRHHIRWLAVFGSAVRDDFRPESDVDVLVEFEPDRTPGLAFFRLPEELSPLFGGRAVDLGTKRSLNRWLRDDVLKNLDVLYDAT